MIERVTEVDWIDVMSCCDEYFSETKMGERRFYLKFEIGIPNFQSFERLRLNDGRTGLTGSRSTA